ncbi:MAG: hypothetical protein EZS28_002780 [Streblomastix strix]|uniref:Reverse transcriptase domain-containing protein n=1 Tax=Streblomastix strix TaxID=222440 RepID=A0A5J4X4W6_9EUKA|nr:MAG: hypothetical protein EZS28_002780 [Streblomastix strix]
MTNDYATTMDMHQAFHHIRVAEKMRSCLCFSFNDHSYSYKVILFGVSMAQRTLIKCLQPQISNAWKRYSSKTYVNVEDIRILIWNPIIQQHEMLQLVKTLQEFGWVIAKNMSQINSSAGSRVREQAVQQEINDLVNEFIQKEGNCKAITTSDGTGKEKVTRKNN